MTTLGSLSVGLLVLVLVVAVGIALLARRRRKATRGPEQPRTVADLVRMREATAQAAAPVAGEPLEAAQAASAGSQAQPEESVAAEEPTEVVATGPDESAGAPGAVSPEEAPSKPVAESEAEAGEAPDPASPMTTPASVQDTPWARAARMADPHGEWTASARAARDREASFGPRPVPPVKPKGATPDKPPTPPARPRLSLLHSDRPEPGHDTTTVAHLPQAFTQAAASTASTQQPSDAPAAEAPPAASTAQQAAQSPSAPADEATAVVPSTPQAAPAVSAPQQIAEAPNALAGAGQAPSAPADELAPVVPSTDAQSADPTGPAAQTPGDAEPPAPEVPAVSPIAAAQGDVEDAPEEPVLRDDVTAPVVLPAPPQPPAHLADDETVEIGRGFGLDDSPTVDLPHGFGARPVEPAHQTPSDEPTTRLGSLGTVSSEPAPPEVDDAEGGGSAPQDRVTTSDAPVEPVDSLEALVGAAVVGSGLALAPTNGHVAAPTNGHAAAPTNGHAAGPANGAPVPTPARVAGRVRRSPADTAAEQAAADLALLRTFGVAGPGHTAAADDTEVALEGCGTEDAEPSTGAAQPVSFRVVGRDGRGLPGASVTLLDDHGREIAGTVADDHGAGRLTARRPGGYMLVTAAAGYQPGAVAIAVSDAAVDAEIPLTRSASIAGSVGGEDGPIVGAQLVLVQDGEIVETAESGADGAYRFADLAAGEYGLSVSASEWEPAAVVLRLSDEADLCHDVDLDPAGLPTGGAGGDVMIGHL